MKSVLDDYKFDYEPLPGDRKPLKKIKLAGFRSSRYSIGKKPRKGLLDGLRTRIASR